MFDTIVTIVGNALNTPEWRRLERSHALVAKFKVAATSRRYDKESGRWVDGASLRVRVNCWRRLAENVASSVLGGDPVIVTGRMYTRDWIGEDNQRRISYELDAIAVGHDLSRGRSVFTRQRPGLGTTAIDDDQAEGRVGGEPAERLVPRRVDDVRSADQQVQDEALSVLRAAGLAVEPAVAAEEMCGSLPARVSRAGLSRVEVGGPGVEAAKDYPAEDRVGLDFAGADAVGADAVGADAVGADAVGADAVGAHSSGTDPSDAESCDVLLPDWSDLRAAAELVGADQG